MAGPVITVKAAVAEYPCVRKSRERTQPGHRALKRGARSRFSKHVLQSALAAKALYKLEAKDLREWRRALPPAMALLQRDGQALGSHRVIGGPIIDHAAA